MEYGKWFSIAGNRIWSQWWSVEGAIQSGRKFTVDRIKRSYSAHMVIRHRILFTNIGRSYVGCFFVCIQLCRLEIANGLTFSIRRISNDYLLTISIGDAILTASKDNTCKIWRWLDWFSDSLFQLWTDRKRTSYIVHIYVNVYRLQRSTYGQMSILTVLLLFV